MDILLVPMKEEEFQEYTKNSTAEFAQDKVASGNWHPDEALKRAEQEFQNELPNGLKTENQHLYSLIDEANGQKVGMIWFMLDTKRPIPVAFIFDFMILEPFRRMGFGLKALQICGTKSWRDGSKADGTACVCF